MEISLQAFLAIWIPKKRKWLKRKKSERKKGYKVQVANSLNPFRSYGDQYQISPYNDTTCSKGKVLRVNELQIKCIDNVKENCRKQQAWTQMK